MKEKEPQSNARSEELAEQIISVPKSEIDKREAEYQKSRKAAKTRRAA